MQDPTDRRSVLRVLAGGCLAAFTLPRLVGCAAQPEPAGPVSLNRAEAEQAGRITVTWQDQPVEVRHVDGRFAARSLACTHLGCKVRWSPENRRYYCPCHAGIFDAEGVPISGPPTAPLREVPVRLEGDLLIVGS